ncbi:MAG: TonB-dependent receptor [Prevotella sp.]|nr:TonB-dependent receptor [Prevotella sp.]
MSVKMKSMRSALMLTLLLFVGSISAQTVKVNVKDSQGEPVIGASVMEKDTRNGGVTDFDGNFTIKLTANKPIVISYIGMKSKTIDAKGKSDISVTLEDDNTTLQEVVAIGYGTVKKKDLTGSVATVNSDDLKSVPVANASEAITGKLAGVQVTTTEGSPDADVSIRVRGGGSITQSNEPLYIVDGFPVEGISNIPSSDIEDITVLKDASSTAIYGSRGANGVILVTTKSGKAGKPKVSYNAYYSWKKIAKTYDVLSSGDYTKWQYEYDMLKNGNAKKYESKFGAFQDMDLYNNVATNDWQDLTFGRTGHTFNHDLSVSGGSDNITYVFSYAHMNDKAIMEMSSFKRDNFSLKLNTKPTKNTKLDFRASYGNTVVWGGGANDAKSTSNTDKRLKYAIWFPPFPGVAASTEDDTSEEDGGSLINPLLTLKDNDRKQDRKDWKMDGSFQWEIFKNFKVKTEFGYTDRRTYDQKYLGLSTYYVRTDVKDYTNHPVIRLVDTDRHSFRNTNTINYDFKKLLKGTNHNLTALAGHEYIITKKRENTTEIRNFPTNFDADMAWHYTSQGIPYNVADLYSADDKLLSYFTRINYNYDSKYYVDFTFRADESSKFSEGNRWGYFPSVALAWRASSEKFMDFSKDWLDDLKVRLSFGTAGNNGIDPGYIHQELISQKIEYVNGYSSYFGPSTRMANPDLKWETTITRNLGLDLVFLAGRLNLSLDAYWNTTKDLLIDFPMSGAYTSQYRNMGKTENKGLEATFTYHVVDKKDWGITVNGNISFNKSKIKSLGEGMEAYGINSGWASSDINEDYWIQEGLAVGQIRGYQNIGRYEVDDFTGYDGSKWVLKPGVSDASPLLGHNVRPGDMKLVDIDGDGIISEKDRTLIGNTNPTAIGGFGITARAYGFDLSANFNFSIGNDVYNASKIDYTTGHRNGQFRNMIDIMADGKRWTNIDANGNLVNDPDQLRAMNANTTMWSPYMNKYILTDWAVEDGSFLRLNTLTLGYTLPKNIVKRAHLTSLRFYVTTYNLFCITGYSGLDPEVSTIRRTNLTPGVDYSAYPKSRQFVVGLNLNF